MKTYEAIVKGENIPEPGIPESFKVLIKEMQSLALDVKMFNDRGEEVELKDSYDTELLPELEKIIASDVDKTTAAEEYFEEGSGFSEKNPEEDENERGFHGSGGRRTGYFRGRLRRIFRRRVKILRNIGQNSAGYFPRSPVTTSGNKKT